MSNPFYPRKHRVADNNVVLLRVFRNGEAFAGNAFKVELVGGVHAKKVVEWIEGLPQTWEPFKDGVKYTLDEERCFALIES